MGFAGYFLIVADFIRWARENEIPVGPGRGSGAGSLVAYALGITDIDPIEHDLLFERFLNPERVSMPDFDVDFCMDRRDEVIDYVADKYGRERVSQIITYGTMAAKAVVRDVGPRAGAQLRLRRPHRQAGARRARTSRSTRRSRRSRSSSALYKEDDEVRNLLDLAARSRASRATPACTRPAW